MHRKIWLDTLIGALAGSAIGVLTASFWLSIAFKLPLDGYSPLQVFAYDASYIRLYPREFGIAAAIFFGATALFIALALTNTWFRKTTDYGDAHWQTAREIRKGGFYEPPGRAFLLGKLGSPRSRKPFLTGETHPHCLMVAPTGAGKGVGFVIPNLLMFAGSVIVLDIKGENYAKTARHRANRLKDKVLRFDPLDDEGRTHRFNPLQAVAELDGPVARFTALARMAELFIHDQAGGKQDWIDGAKRLFIAGCLLTIERREATLGAVLRLFQMPDGQKETLSAYAGEVRDAQAGGIFLEYAGMPERTLGSYISILTNAGGLGLWSNPAVDHATSKSDWAFEAFRVSGHALYLCSTTTDLKALAPLMRLLLGQAIATLQARQPGPDEPLPVMFMIDEFDQLGRMEIFVESMKTLRAFGGRVMIVTQSVPGLAAIYGENQRLSIEAAAGVKLYITPQDPKTARELSQAIGNATRLRRSVSRKERSGFMARSNVSLSEEARPLLTEQDARRLDPETIIILPAGQHPIKARRIKYFEDRRLAPLFEAQSGPLPHEVLSPASTAAALADLRAQEALRQLAQAQQDAAETRAELSEVTDRIRFIEEAFRKDQKAPTVPGDLDLQRAHPGATDVDGPVKTEPFDSETRRDAAALLARIERTRPETLGTDESTDRSTGTPARKWKRA